MIYEYIQTDGPTDGQTDLQTDRPTDRPSDCASTIVSLSHRGVLWVEVDHDILVALEGCKGHVGAVLVFHRETRGIGADLESIFRVTKKKKKRSWATKKENQYHTLDYYYKNKNTLQL